MSLLDLLFPKKCVGCKKFGEYLCPNCFAKLSFDAQRKCLVCDKPSFNGMTHPRCVKRHTIDGYFAVLSYKGILKRLLYQFKYSPYLTDLQTILGDLLYEELIQDEEFMELLKQNPLLIPIPLSNSKQRKRGYNHAEILAKNLGKRFNLPVENLLKRIKETKPQYGLKREERMENMKDAFGMAERIGYRTNGNTSSRQARTKIALLVDDVVTTGSTLIEATKVLKKNGFGQVYGVALAQD